MLFKNFHSKGEVLFVGFVESVDTDSFIRIYPEFCEGLEKLEEFSHIIVLYWFHLRDNKNIGRH